MKKKLLSLVLAGAMVASTSVSAFAATPNVTGPDTESPKTNVTITGEVVSDGGAKPTGKFNVTVPTAASFAVTKDSTVISVPIVIENNGAQSINVYAEKFADVTIGSEITVVDNDSLTGEDRTKVSLTLSGDNGMVYLKSEDNNNSKTNYGIYSNSDLTTPASTDDSKLLTTISNGRTGEITLKGNAGSEATNNTASDNFTLTLKIKKA